MVKHIIIWDFKDELSAEEKAEGAARIKNDLEALNGVVEGAVNIHVVTDILDSSNGSLLLDSVFEDEAALAAYAVHPEHVKVKDYIGTLVKARKCVDYII